MKHWVYDAAEAHRDLILRLQCPSNSPDGGGHLIWMIDQLKDMTPTKACRWLGWIQGVLYCRGVASLDELKALNKHSADAAKTRRKFAMPPSEDPPSLR